MGWYRWNCPDSGETAAVQRQHIRVRASTALFHHHGPTLGGSSKWSTCRWRWLHIAKYGCCRTYHEQLQVLGSCTSLSNFRTFFHWSQDIARAICNLKTNAVMLMQPNKSWSIKREFFWAQIKQILNSLRDINLWLLHSCIGAPCPSFLHCFEKRLKNLT